MRSLIENSVVIRPAQLADVRIVHQFIRSYYEFDDIPFEGKIIRAGLLTLLRSKSAGQAFVICLASKPIGYAILTYGFDLEFGGTVALMTDLYLEPGYRGLGVGKKTILFLQKFCQRLRIRVLELQVERQNKSAHSFYQALGFIAHDRIPMSKRMGRLRQKRRSKYG